MKSRKLPSIDRLRELFLYEDGALIRRTSVHGGAKGTRAGVLKRNGYREVGVDYGVFLEHRIIWALCHGFHAPDRIDHIDRNRSNNRIENLRLATGSQNNANSCGTRRGPKGVTFHRRAGKWQAQIGVAGSMRYLGLFETEREAADAYDVAAIELFGEFAVPNHGATP